MAKLIGVGILGGGGILGAHAPGFSSIKDKCKVLAVAEPNKNNHENIRKLVGADVRIVGDYSELLAMPEIDAVDILLPHDLHMPATIAAAKAGKHVLTEKVMARNVWECDKMIEACEKAGVTLTVSHDRRYNSQWMGLKEIVDSGVLGKIFHWKLDHNQDVSVPPTHWIYSKNAIGGGSIMSCLTHQIDALRWYGGEVASVTAMGKVLPGRMEGESVGVIGAQMKSGALAMLSINWFTRSMGYGHGENALWYEMVQACGDKGEAYYMSGRGTFLRMHDRNAKGAEKLKERFGEKIFDGFVPYPTESKPGHVGCIQEWIKSLRGEKSHVTTSGKECRGTVEVAEAAYISMDKRKVVDLPVKPIKWKNVK